MKGQRIRYQQTGEFHFVTFSCYRRRTYLAAVAAMELFEDALERVRRRYHFAVAGYVVMPEHVHLLLNEPQRALLSKAIQALKLSVSMRGRERPFWQAHYYDFNVSSHNRFVEKLRYIHRNPVRRGLVAKPEEWKWSSFRHYQTGVRRTVEIESEWTARQRGWQLPEWLPNRQRGASSPVPKGERGTGGTLKLIRFLVRSGPPAGIGHRGQPADARSMPALIVGVGDVFRAVRREGHSQDAIQGVIGVLCGVTAGGSPLGQVAGVVVVVDGRTGDRTVWFVRMPIFGSFYFCLPVYITASNL